MTVAISGSSAERARVARSARYSCAKLNTPLMTTTAMIAQPSWGMPPTNAKTAATQSINAKRWTI